MDKDPRPIILEQDYGRLLSLIQRHFPEAYDEWPRTHADWLELDDQWLSERRRRGRETQRIKVCPEEFIEFCLPDGRKGTLQDLWRWAQHEAFRRAEQQRELQAQADYDPYSFEAVD